MNGYHKFKGEKYIIEQFSPKTANICLTTPYYEGFVKEELQKEIKGVLKPIIDKFDILDKDYIIFIDATENINKEAKHNDTKIEIWLKFKKDMKFKEKIKFITENVISFLQNIIP